MRFTITPKTHTLGEKRFTSYVVCDNLFLYERPNGTKVTGRRVASFSKEADAIQYAEWRNRLNDLPQQGDAA